MKRQQEQDLIEDLGNAREERDELKEKLSEIIEIYAGMEGFIPETAPEAYQARIIEQMYNAAVKS